MFPLVAHYLQGALGAEAFGSEPGISGAPWYDGRKKDQVEAGRGACEEIGAPSSDRPLLMEGAIQAGGGCILQPRPRFGCRGYVRPDHAGALDRYFLYREPADRRQSFDGLGGQVRRGLKRDPISGNALVFIHRRRIPRSLSSLAFVGLDFGPEFLEGRLDGAHLHPEGCGSMAFGTDRSRMALGLVAPSGGPIDPLFRAGRLWIG